METDDIPNADYNLWLPMTNKGDIAALAKLVEECGELASICARCLMQGVDQCEPVTGKANERALIEEIADVTAMLQIVEERFNLSIELVVQRALLKYRYKKKWIKDLDDLK